MASTRLASKAAMLFFVSIFICSCSSTTSYKGFLWKVTRKNDSSTAHAVYLWGVLHSVPVNSDIEFSNQLTSAFEKSNVFVVESDVESAKLDFKKATPSLPEDLKLENYVQSKTILKLEKYLDQFSDAANVKPRMLQQHPVTLYFWLTLAAPPARSFETTSTAKKIAKPDLIFLEKAKENQKLITYLEPAEAVYLSWAKTCPTALDGSKLIDQYLDILMADKKPNFNLKTTPLNEDDLSAFELEYAKSRAALVPEETFFRCAIVPRNADWVEKIIEFSGKKQDTFITFGAGHLAGDKGVIALLRARGLNVEAIVQNNFQHSVSK
jgi:uncharacterized protein